MEIDKEELMSNIPVGKIITSKNTDRIKPIKNEDLDDLSMKGFLRATALELSNIDILADLGVKG